MLVFHKNQISKEQLSVGLFLTFLDERHESQM